MAYMSRNQKSNRSEGEIMNAKEYLEKVRNDEDYLKRKSVELYQMKCLETSISAPLNPDKVQSSSPADKLGNLISKRIDFEKELAALVVNYANYKSECIGVLEEVRKDSHTLYSVLHKHYIEYAKLIDIAADMGYSYQRIKELHREGLEKVQKILEKYKVHT